MLCCYELINQNGKGVKSKLIQVAAEDIPFADNSFDIVFSMTVIQNFDDIE